MPDPGTPCAGATLDAAALQRLAAVYEQRLRTDPADVPARSGLSWCLFLRAVWAAGRESDAQRQTPSAEPATQAAVLLAEALHQGELVLLLCGPEHAAERALSERLRLLARLGGAAAAVQAAETGTEQLLGRLAREVAPAVLSEERRPRYRRFTRHPPRPRGA
jgi:hypothetical protein